MMKVVRHDAARSAVTASPGMATTSAALCGAHASSLITTILKSLFDGSWSCPRAANPLNFRHFRRRAIGGSDEIACNFPC